MKIHRLRAVAVGVGLAGVMAVGPAMAQGSPPASAGGAAGASTSAPPAAGADQDKKVNEAKSRYKAGLALYDDGAYEAARVQFERAYELAPNYKILYNVGLVYKQLNEFVGALKSLQQYLAEGGNEVAADRKAEVTKLIESLRGVIASANVTVNAPGAEITVDDAVVGTAPLSAPILLNPGRRKIGAKMPGKIPDNKVVTVASGDVQSIQLTLQEAVVINKGTDVKPILAWAVTGGLAIAAGVTGFLALGASKDRANDLSQKDVTRDQIDKDTSKQKTLAVVSDVLTIGAIVGVGVAVYFTWFNKPSEKEKKSPPPGSPDAEQKAARIKVTPGLGSVLVQF